MFSLRLSVADPIISLAFHFKIQHSYLVFYHHYVIKITAFLPIHDKIVVSTGKEGDRI